MKRPWDVKNPSLTQNIESRRNESGGMNKKKRFTSGTISWYTEILSIVYNKRRHY
jgi:hypothetical protein